jgi:asparagine synthase (glutamine-hydrolysing)
LIAKKPRLDRIMARNLLSIRYNPEEDPLITPAHSCDFLTRSSDPEGIETERLLKQSISQSLSQKKGPFLISLSSGIDSTLCLALTRKVFPRDKIIAICGVFEGSFDESERARKIAETFEADFRVVNMDSVFASLPELVHISRRPKWNTYQHLVTKEAQKFGGLLITGDGADEIFGGYTFRYNKFLTLSRPKDNWRIKVINYLECHNRDWVPDQGSMFGSSIKFDWELIYNYFRSHFTSKLEPLKQVMLADFNGKLLFDFIPAGKAISDYYDVQSIPVFLDERVRTHGFALPLDEKYDNVSRKGKVILRNIAKRIGIEHIEEKRGFSPSLLFDWQERGKEASRQYLLDKGSYIYKKKIINFNWVLRSMEKVDNDGDIRYLNRLISILALEIYCRIFVTHEMIGSDRL